MIVTNANWNAKNAVLAKRPLYCFVIDGIAPAYASHDLAAFGVTGAPAYKPWLITPKGASQSIDVLGGRSSIGKLQVEVVEHSTDVLAIVAGNQLVNRDVTLWGGYPGMAFADFVALQTYRIDSVYPNRTYTGWVFDCLDKQSYVKTTIYKHPLNGALISKGNPWIIQGSVGEIVQAMYVLGLNRPVAELDLDALNTLDSPTENLFSPARPFLFSLQEPVEVKQFLETEIYKVAACFPVVDNLGRISLRASRPPAAGPSPVFTFNQTNMTVLPGIERYPITNTAIYRFDDGAAFGESGFRTEQIYIEGTSISTYLSRNQHVVESKGLRAGLGGNWFTQWAAARLFQRFGGIVLRDGAAILTIEAFYMTLPVWIGDFVYASHPLMPDVQTGAIGVVNRIYQVIDREPDYASGRMQYKLLDTGVTADAAFVIDDSASPGVAVSSVVVPANSTPWNNAGGINAAYQLTLPGNFATGVAPVVVAAAAGDLLALTYVSGTIVTSGGGPALDPSGTNSSPGQDSAHPGQYVAGSCQAASLTGCWTDVTGQLVAAPFEVGLGWTGTCPIGAVQLQLGVNDNVWSDNFGSWTMHLRRVIVGNVFLIGLSPVY